MRYLVFGLLLMAQAVFGQSPKLVAELRAFEQARYKALISKDFEATEQFVADDLVYTHSNCTVEDKAAYMDALRTGKYDFTQFATDSTEYRVLNKKTVVATGSASIALKLNGRDVALTARFTAVYVHRRGRWQLMAWQTTRRL